jgi:hypothetical protein
MAETPDSNETEDPTAGVTPTSEATSSSIKLNELDPIQQFLAMFVISLAKNFNPNETLEDGDFDFNNFFASLLGFDDTESYKEYWNDNLSPETPSRAWRDNVPSNIDYSRARQLAVSSDIDIGERQETVMSTIPLAAEAAGVSAEFMTGLWGVESGYGTNRLSPSGCLGDFQFTRGTFREVMEKHGDKIEAHLRANGQDAIADRMINARGDDQLLALRDDPTISTYASAYYVKDVAGWLDIDPTQDQNWGELYAGYNIGSGNAAKLSGSLAHTENVGKALGSVASWNPMFFRNGETGLEALDNYRDKIVSNIRAIDTPNSDVAFASTGRTTSSTQEGALSTDVTLNDSFVAARDDVTREDRVTPDVEHTPGGLAHS